MMNFLHKKMMLISICIYSLALAQGERHGSLLTFENSKRYGSHFALGFVSQMGLNELIDFQTRAWHLPHIEVNKKLILTASGAAFATLPFMLTLTALGNLGITNIADTIKGTSEAHAKKTLQTVIDQSTIEESAHSNSKAKEEAHKNALRSRLANYKLTKVGALAGARGTLLVRTLTIGTTILSLVGPLVLDAYSPAELTLAELTLAELPLVELPLEIELRPEYTKDVLSTENRIMAQLNRLEKSEKDAKTSPIIKMTHVTPEQCSFFAGQLVGTLIPHAVTMRAITVLKNGSMAVHKSIKKVIAYYHNKSIHYYNG